MGVLVIKEKLLQLLSNKSEVNSLGQNPRMWFSKNGIEDLWLELFGNQILPLKCINIIKPQIIKYLRGETNCCCCNNTVERLLPGWKGFCKTCADKCENVYRSQIQSGNNNTCHRMTKEVRENSHKKVSATLKAKILSGQYTPRSENYFTHKPIIYKNSGMILNFRSLWEVIYFIQNKDLEYEKIRISYWDTETSKYRIAITDFYDNKTNSIIEVKPRKFQTTQNFKDRCKTIEEYCNVRKWNFKIADESDLFYNMTKEQIVDDIRKNTANFEQIKHRLKWLKLKT